MMGLGRMLFEGRWDPPECSGAAQGEPEAGALLLPGPAGPSGSGVPEAGLVLCLSWGWVDFLLV